MRAPDGCGAEAIAEVIEKGICRLRFLVSGIHWYELEYTVLQSLQVQNRDDVGDMCKYEYVGSTLCKTGTILHENISPCASCWKFYKLFGHFCTRRVPI